MQVTLRCGSNFENPEKAEEFLDEIGLTVKIILLSY